MKRTLILLGAAAIALGGCSGSKKAEGDAAPAKAAASKGGKEKPHNNPWAKDASGPDAADAGSKPAPAGAKAAEKPKDNPWAKEPPPGSVPPAAEKDAKKK